MINFLAFQFEFKVYSAHQGGLYDFKSLVFYSSHFNRRGKPRGGMRGGRSGMDENMGMNRDMSMGGRGGFSGGRGGYHQGGYRGNSHGGPGGSHGGPGSGLGGRPDLAQGEHMVHHHGGTGGPGGPGTGGPGGGNSMAFNKPAPEFEMKGNDFPALPGLDEPQKVSEITDAGSATAKPWDSKG